MSGTSTATPLAKRAQEYFENLQRRLVVALETMDGGARFRADRWERAEGGGGLTQILSGGALFEKAGVNTSAVWGDFDAAALSKLGGSQRRFFAAGMSLVLHPLNPMVPTVHANFRYLERGDDAWFGGGSDLTPYYPYKEDVAHFHRTWRDVCARFDPAYYPRFKRWCDEYFYLPHRKEARGVGGIFFDDLVTPFLGLYRDNNLRPDSSVEKLASLKPVFGVKAGDATMTAGNSTPLTDGASVSLLATGEWAAAHGIEPLAYYVDAETAAA